VSFPLAISVGDPAGIGPEVTVRALAAELGDDSAVVFGEAESLAPAMRRHGVRVSEVVEPGAVQLVDVGTVSTCTRAARAPTVEGGAFQLECLVRAGRFALEGRARALVTGPMSKAAVELTGVKFTGQTEALAELAGLRAADVTMMFLGPKLNVALVTTHHSVVEAARVVSAERVERTVRHMAEAIIRLGRSAAPVIVVTGVNPHAGEGGLFGREEIDAVGPGIERARTALPEIRLEGPIPAEAAFRMARDGKVDGVVAMLHDQATIASKLLDWGEAVNVTWGLPFVRTSVDHGVAYDIAGEDHADDSGMRAAIRLARQLGAS
jgi:4-hydroxythreonine-4-phosphate dehydrogenase